MSFKKITKTSVPTYENQVQVDSCDQEEILVKLVVTKQPHLIRTCPKCGKVSHYENAGKFRVNANKKALDIWLIYRCLTCKHTWNRTIYERIKPTSLPIELLEAYHLNDEALSLTHGLELDLIRGQEVKVDLDSLTYKVVYLSQVVVLDHSQWTGVLRILSDYPLPLKLSKILADLMETSVSQIKQLESLGRLSLLSGASLTKARCQHENVILIRKT